MKINHFRFLYVLLLLYELANESFGSAEQTESIMNKKVSVLGRIMPLIVAGIMVSCSKTGTTNTNSTEEAMEETEQQDAEPQYEGVPESQPSENSNQQKPAAKTARKQAPQESISVYYEGRIGNDEARMNLTFVGNNVTGTLEKMGEKSKLKGTVDEDGEIHLTEVGKNGKMVSTSHRRKRRFRGDYTKNGKSIRFRFRKSSPDGESDVVDIYR